MVFFSLSLSPWKLTTLLRERRGHTERVHEIHVPVDSLGSQPTVSIKTKPCKQERLHVISAWPSSQTLVRAQTSYSHSALPDPNCRSISQINIIIYLSQDFLALPYWYVGWDNSLPWSAVLCIKRMLNNIPGLLPVAIPSQVMTIKKWPLGGKITPSWESLL